MLNRHPEFGYVYASSRLRAQARLGIRATMLGIAIGAVATAMLVREYTPTERHVSVQQPPPTGNSETGGQREPQVAIAPTLHEQPPRNATAPDEAAQKAYAEPAAEGTPSAQMATVDQAVSSPPALNGEPPAAVPPALKRHVLANGGNQGRSRAPEQGMRAENEVASERGRNTSQRLTTIFW
jgi:hypothetical protein